MRLPEDFIRKVLDATDIVDIIGQHTVLKGRGAQLMGLCPFPTHAERTPSFSVSQNKQLFHCFGCKEGGNVFHFLEKYYGFSFIEAVEFLAHRASIPIPTFENSDDQKSRNHRRALLEVNQLAAEFYRDTLMNLPHHHSASSYLHQRGLSRETIKSFSLGYAPAEWDRLVRHLKARNVNLALAYELGLIKKNKHNEFIDGFRDRIIFPILSLSEEVLGFGGRTLGDDTPKYLNSSDSVLFHKGKTLYGMNQAARYLRNLDHAIVVEGYMDLLALTSVGIGNVVATLGTALTLDQVKLIRRHTRNIAVLFDGDKAGQEAAYRSLPILLEGQTYPKHCFLPESLDPDEFLKKYGAEPLRERLANAPELFFSYLDSLMEGYRADPSDKVKIVNLLKPLFSKIGEKPLASLYAGAVARKLRVQPQWIGEALSLPGETPLKSQNASKSDRSMGIIDESQKANQSLENTSDLNKIPISASPRMDLLFLVVCLRNRSYFEEAIKEGAYEWLSDPNIKKIFSKAVELSRQSPGSFDNLIALIASQVSEPKLLTEKFNSIDTIIGEEGQFRALLSRIRDQYLARQALKIAKDLGENPTTEQLVQLMNIQRNRRSLSETLDGSPDQDDESAVK